MATSTATEFYDSEEVYQEKLALLKGLIDEAESMAVFTGAGISTAASIPDYSGDEGLKAKPKPMIVLGLQERELDFVWPTASHVIVSRMVESGKVMGVVTSNHDNLHTRAGVPPGKLVDLFGNVMVEKCLSCKGAFHRHVVCPSIGRKCRLCGGRLQKAATRMNSMTPEDELRNATNIARTADFALVLGSSMTVGPFCDLPTYAKKMVLVTLQETPYDSVAVTCIHMSVDRVMRDVAAHLRVPSDPHVISMPFEIATEPESGGRWKVTLRCKYEDEPPTWIESVSLTWSTNAAPVELDDLGGANGGFQAVLPLPEGCTTCTANVVYKEGLGHAPAQVPFEVGTAPTLTNFSAEHRVVFEPQW